MAAQNFTPWNVDINAVRHVHNPIPSPCTKCTFCGGRVGIRHYTEVYAQAHIDSWPWLYSCDGCGARVGIHKNTDIPLGTLADDKTRLARLRAKRAFKTYARNMRTHRAYAVLARHMHLPVRQCHFGWFTLDQCLVAALICDLRL